jgi:hypothetical protein
MRAMLFRAALGLVLGASAAAPAAAHHGWSWTVEEISTLSGVIEEIYLGNPHAVLRVRTAGGEVWEVDLAPPSRTIAAGFDDDAAKVGDEIILFGNRSAEEGDLHMKAIRVQVNGETYDVYPDRVDQLPAL